MKYQIKDFAKLTNVSVRTLHYYDGIGLLKPAFVDKQNSYRFYDEKSLERMQEILFYRELDFTLKEISNILSAENYNKSQALNKQKQLLLLKKKHIERLISAIDCSLKGESIMISEIFNNNDYEKLRNQYAQEAKQKWGGTDAYSECKEKTSNYSKEKWNNVNEEMDTIFAEFAECMQKGEASTGQTVQGLVKKLQDFITDNFYNCTNEILSGLGAMYSADERFRKNIDKHGIGNAEYISKAIEVYCS